MIPQTLDAPAPDELAADLVRAAELDAKDAAAAAELAPGEAPPPPVDYRAEARDFIGFARSLFVPLYPRLEPVYTDATCDRIADAAAPVMQKYGFTLGALFGRFGPEIGLAIVLAPLVGPTLAAVRAPRQAPSSASSASSPPKNGESSNGFPTASPSDDAGDAFRQYLKPENAPQGPSPLAGFNL